jgi:hypothetical protein
VNESILTNPSERTTRETSTLQLVVSFVIGMYLIFLLASLLLNQAGSQLISRLATAGIPLSIVGLQTDFPLEFHFSQAMNFDDDHHFEVIIKDEVVRRYPSATTNETGIREGFRYDRFHRLAHQAAISVTEEDDATLSEMARGIGEFAASQGVGERMVVRLVGHTPYDWRQQPPQPLAESLDPEFYSTIYEADVWRAESGSMNVHKRVVAAEAAPPLGGGS